MLVQPITNQNYSNYQIKKQNNSTSFKGELGAKVLKEIATSGAKDQKGISEVLKNLGIGFMGLLSLSKLKDILEAVAAKNDELEEKQKQIEEQEQILINTKNIIRQSEADSIKSATRIFYGIEDPETTSYDSIAEQCLEISSVLSGIKNVKISNLNSNTLQDLAVAMQNKDGRFTKDALTFLERIANMHDFDINDLTTTINIVKDNDGNIDMERSTHFIALYSLKDSRLKTVNRELAKYYNLSSEKPATEKADTENIDNSNNKINSTLSADDKEIEHKTDGVMIKLPPGGWKSIPYYGDHPEEAVGWVARRRF